MQMPSKVPAVVELTVGRARADDRGHFCKLNEGSGAGWREGGVNSFSDGVQGRLLRGGDI